MSFGAIMKRVVLVAAVLAAFAVPAFAGKAYIDALEKIRKGDPEGLVEMEKVCQKEPFASNAFLALSHGYLSIKKDSVMAMDAALRGLEQYDEKWKYKVPKRALYDAFLAGAAKSGLTPEALGRPMARIEKLAKRDAQEAQPVLAKYDAFRPAKLVPAIAAQVRTLQGRNVLGQALVLHDLGVEIAKVAGLESELEASLKPGRELAEKARQELDEALKLDGQ